MENYFGEMWLARILLQKGIAAIYFVAFASAYNQFPALLGEHGLLPAPQYMKIVKFKEKPSIFHWYYSDAFLKSVACCGLVLSVILLSGLNDNFPLWISTLVWLIVWVLYLSIVNVGQTFYAFGWESMLLEAGLISAFLANPTYEPNYIPLLILRWMLFRTEIGAGLIKLRHDSCWRDLTCLYYHYETQPLPNPLSWFFHRFPQFFQRFSVLFSHFVQLIVPFFLFAPQPIASVAASLIILHQLFLIVSGNYSWLNWLTVILGFSAISDQFLGQVMPLSRPDLIPAQLWYDIVLWFIAGLVIFLSYKPILNLFSSDQLMNYSYNPFHFINTYGAFGSISKHRYEIVIEGTTDKTINEHTRWKEYEFKAKPGSLKRCPPIIAPYHLRIDWLMWFLPFRVIVFENGISHGGYDRWFIKMIEKLLTNDKNMLSLLAANPFKESPPTFIRARFFLYQFSNFSEWSAEKIWWKRTFVDDYLLPCSLQQSHESYK